MSTDAPVQPYPRAPIAEAIIEIRAVLPPATSLDDLRKVVAGLDEGDYPKVESRIAFEEQIDVGNGEVTTQARHRQLGFTFSSADQKQAFHARLDGFAFSRSAPYEQWDVFSREGMRLWDAYSGAVDPQVVTRIGVRYINDIRVPLPFGIEIKDYLRTYPEISPDLPQLIQGYFMQVRIPLVMYQATATVIGTVIGRDDDSSLILDIDCYNEGSIDLTEPRAREQIEERLTLLRRAKNAVFEACITPRTRELFT